MLYLTRESSDNRYNLHGRSEWTLETSIVS